MNAPAKIPTRPLTRAESDASYMGHLRALEAEQRARRLKARTQALVDFAEAIEPFDDRDRPHPYADDGDRDPYFARRF